MKRAARRLVGGLAMALVVLIAGSAGLSMPAPQVPSPESVIGFAPCSDYRLATSEQIAAYLHSLDRASARVTLEEIGRTVEGRPQLLAFISSERNLERRGRFQDIARRLALARGLSVAEAQALAADGRAVIWIDFGLHSSEVAHSQAASWLAYRLATAESEESRFIRDNVILLLMPDMNPDGTTLVARWYTEHVGTPFEDSSPPVLYHKYVGHDNNRDYFMFNMPESRNVAQQLYHEWFPQIVHNHHQAGPFPSRIFVPPFADPTNPHIPALVMRGIDLVGEAIQTRLERDGASGVVSRMVFDTWWNGGMRTTPYFHNMIGILTETAHASASPAHYDPATFPRAFENGTPTLEPSADYPRPYRGGTWRMRDSCELMLSSSMAVLDIGARRRQQWLFDIYRMGRDAIASGTGETYVVSADQWDGSAAVRMVNALRTAGVEVSRARAPFNAGGATFPAGSFVIDGAQPFIAHVRDLLGPQMYPDRRPHPGGRPEQPYDMTGWTLPMQMGVAVDRIQGRFKADLEPVERARIAPRTLNARPGDWIALDPRLNSTYTVVNRLLARGIEILRSTVPVQSRDGVWPAGTFVVQNGPGPAELLARGAGELGVAMSAIDDMSPDKVVRINRPRVGLYQAWGGNIDEGWTRWLLEQYEFGFDSLHDAEIRAGNLRDRFDVILLPQNTSEHMRSGLSAGSMPPEYTGGMTAIGVSNLNRFVNDGGTLVAFDSASDLPVTAFVLGVENVARRYDESRFFAPGTLVRLTIDPSHALGFGLPRDVIGFFARGPLFEVRGQAEGAERVKIAARFARQDLTASGWLLGADVLAGRPALIEAPVGRGRVVLIGFRAQHRGQTDQTFKVLFNAILLGGAAAHPGLARTERLPVPFERPEIAVFQR